MTEDGREKRENTTTLGKQQTNSLTHSLTQTKKPTKKEKKIQIQLREKKAPKTRN